MCTGGKTCHDHTITQVKTWKIHSLGKSMVSLKLQENTLFRLSIASVPSCCLPLPDYNNVQWTFSYHFTNLKQCSEGTWWFSGFHGNFFPHRTLSFLQLVFHSSSGSVIKDTAYSCVNHIPHIANLTFTKILLPFLFGRQFFIKFWMNLYRCYNTL